MLTGWGAVLVRTIIGLFLVPLLLSHFGKDGYGIIGLLGVLLSLTIIADLGLRNALGRELSEQHARRNHRAFNELLTTSLFLYVIIAILLSIAVFISAPWLTKQFKVPDPYINITINMIRVYGTISIVLSFITPVFSATLSSHNRFDIINSTIMASGLISSAIIVFIVKYVYNGLWIWVFAQLFGQMLLVFLQYSYYHRLCKPYAIAVRYINISRLKSLFHLGGYMYLIQLTQAIAERSDPLIISHYMGPSGVALYNPGNKLTKVARPIVLTMVSQLFPLTTEQHVIEDTDKMQTLLISVTKYTILLGLPISMFLFAYAFPFCRLWLGSTIGSDYKTVALVMMGWSVADLITYCAGSQWPVLLGMKKLSFLVCVNIPAAVLNILLSILIINRTSLGIPGVLVATIGIGLIRRPIIMAYTARVCGLSLKEYLKKSYARPSLVFVLMATVVSLMRYILHSNSYYDLLLQGCIFLIIWIALCWIVGFNAEDKERVNVILKRQ